MTRNREKGFTLIEVIIVLILLGIVSAIAGMGLVVLAQGYVFTNVNSTAVEKGQTAITRIVKELGDCTITAGNATSVTFNRRKVNDITSHTFSWGGTPGDPLILTDPGNDSAVLIDNVRSFALVYYDNGGNTVTVTAAAQVQSTLQLIAADNSVQTFTNRVYITQ